MDQSAALRTTGSGNGRLTAFILAALAFHGAVLWFVDIPEVSRQAPSRIPALRVAIEASPGRQAVEERTPGRVEVPADIQPREVPELPPASPEAPAPPSETTREAGKPGFPRAVSPHALLRDVTPDGDAPAAGFGEAPSTHRIFRPQRLVKAGPPAAAWSRGIWRRSAVTGETRFKTTDGTSVWIRRYDNGDIRVCERARDELMNQWDDHLPFVCER